MKYTTVAATLLGLLVAAFSLDSAQAVVLDFEGLPYTVINTSGDIVPNPNSVLTDNFRNLGVIFGRSGVSQGVAVAQDSFAPSSGVNSVVGLDSNGIIPGGPGAALGDIYFSFVVPSTDTPAAAGFVSFTIGDGGGDVDIFQIRSYNLSNALVDIQEVAGAARFLVNIVAVGIHRVEINFTGDYGYSMDDLDFDLDIVSNESTSWSAIKNIFR